MTKQELTATINTIYEAVDESKAGPFRGCIEGAHFFQTTALEAFRVALNAALPHATFQMAITEPKEGWQE